MSYHLRTEEQSATLKEAGVDYDLDACIHYALDNPQFSVYDIKKVLAVYEGENDGPSWRWVLRLNDDRIVFLTGWCDYTGWDCQSGATATFMQIVHNPEDMIPDTETDTKVRESLIKQLQTTKNWTWRERTEEEIAPNMTFVDPQDFAAHQIQLKLE